MNEKDVKRMVELEIISEKGKKTEHGHIEFERINDFLTDPPYKKQFFNPVDASTEFHWVVLDEDKTSKDNGYLVFYSQVDGAFGLGTKTTMTKGIEAGTFLGIFGTFISTLDSM
jgi:hypothetical protein